MVGAPTMMMAFLKSNVAAALRLLLFTGARLSEILNLEWAHYDVGRGLLLLPDSTTGEKTIVLNAPAVAVLAELPRIGRYVIAGAPAGTNEEKPRAISSGHGQQSLSSPGLRSLAEARKDKKPIVKNREIIMCQRVTVRLRDLRHTHASFGAGAGFSLPMIGKLLGHIQSTTTERYAHLANDPVRKASERVGGDLAAAFGEAPKAPDDVQPIGPRK